LDCEGFQLKRVPAPLLIAHRGGAAEAPENTLAAFRHAIALGIRWFELDVQMSRDGELVVIHDETVDRTTGGRGSVASLTLEELRRLDAGSWFGPEFKGERIPTLREVLELCASHDTGVFIELKSPHLYPGIEEKVASLLAEMRIQGASDIWCISFDPQSVARLRALDASLPLGQLYYPGAHDFSDPGGTVQATLPFYQNAAQHPEQIASTHRAGKQVVVWTVNTGADMRRMADLGVDGIVSDHPSMLLSHFAP
jgi:glycerophosphoryl diester phosphodiesterase